MAPFLGSLQPHVGDDEDWHRWDQSDHRHGAQECDHPAEEQEAADQNNVSRQVGGLGRNIHMDLLRDCRFRLFCQPGLVLAMLAEKAKAAVTQKIHMDIASKTAHLPGNIILVRGFLFFGWMVAFLCSMAVIGLIPTVPIFVVAYMRLEGPEKWRHAALMATVMTTLIYVVFDQLLNIPWPPTLLGTSFPVLKIIPSV